MLKEFVEEFHKEFMESPVLILDSSLYEIPGETTRIIPETVLEKYEKKFSIIIICKQDKEKRDFKDLFIKNRYRRWG